MNMPLNSALDGHSVLSCRAAFDSGMQEQEKNSIKLPEGDFVASRAFQLLYDFMYTSKLEIGEENVYPLITAAHYLRMPTVIVLCTGFLRDNAATMSQDLALQLASLQADDLGDLKTNSLNKIAENFSTYVNSDQMLNSITLDTLEAILKSDRLRIQNESELLATILKWLSSDPNRPQHGDKLLKNVRLGLIPGIDLLPALDKQYLNHLTEYGPILRQIIASKLDKAQEETTRNKYPDHYKMRPLVNLADEKEVGLLWICYTLLM